MACADMARRVEGMVTAGVRVLGHGTWPAGEGVWEQGCAEGCDAHAVLVRGIEEADAVIACACASL